MKVSIKEKAYGLCRSCQTCEFCGIYGTGPWCELPFGETHYFKGELVCPIKQDDIFKL